MGSVYRDLKWNAQAQQYYHKAVEIADTTDTAQLRLLARVYGQLGESYLHLNLSQIASEMHKMQSYYGKKVHSLSIELDGLCKQAECLSKQNNFDSAVVINKYCEEQYRKNGLKTDADACLKTLANLHVFLKKYDVARSYFHRYENESGLVDEEFRIVPIRNREYYYLSKGHYYYGLGILDSALMFYYRLLEVNDTLCKKVASRSIYRAYRKMGKKDSVIKYQSKHIALIRKHDLATQVKQLQELQSHFDITKEREHTRREKERAEEKSRQMWLAVFGAAVLVLAVILFAKLRSSRNKLRLQQLAIHYQIQQKELEETRKLLDKTKGKSDYIRETLMRRIEDLEKARMSFCCSDKSEASSVDQLLFSESSAARHMQELFDNNETVKDKDWTALEEACQIFAPELFEFISFHSGKLSKNDINICLMVYAGFTPKIMSHLLCTSKQNISSIRKRLHLKLFGTDGSPTDFDNRILSIKKL